MATFEVRVATEFNVVSVTLEKEVQERVERLVAARCCTGCERKIGADERIRLGQCDTCYGSTNSSIRRGIITLATLIKEGRVWLRPKGRKPKNAYTKSLQEKRMKKRGKG